MKTLAVVALLSVGFAGPALAMNASAHASVHYDFEDDQVEGDIQRPDGELISSTQRAKHASLIEVRRNLIPESFK